MKWPLKCDACDKMRHCINGRWCCVKNIYVEYFKNIECDYEEDTDNR